MISTGAFLNEMDASNKQPSTAEKFAAVWEKKNAKAARAGGVSLMALSLAACGSSSTTTSTSTDSSTSTSTTTVTPINSELTTGVDNITGTTGADTVSGMQSATAANDTSDSFDVVALGEGSDTLYIINEQNAAYDPIDASGVDTFKYQANDDAGDLDMDDAHGASALVLYRADNDIDVTDVTLAHSVTLDSLRATFDGSVTYKATSVAGAADSATVTIDDAQDGAELTFAGAVETMNLAFSGADSRLDVLAFDAATTAVTIDAGAGVRIDDTLTAAGVTSVTITGAGAVRSDVAFAAATTIDASAATGVMTLTAGATNATITTGAGADVVDMAATLNYLDTIDLGAGDDTLRVDVEGLTAGSRDLSVSNVETLRFDGINTNGAIQMDNLAIATMRFDDAGAANADGGTITLTDLATTTTQFSYIGGGTLDDDLFFSPVTIDYDTSTDVANITITINNGGKVADDILVGTITADMVDVVTINATEVGQAAADEVTITDLIVDKATDVVVTSDGEVIFSGMDGNVLDTLDMSGVNGGSTVQVDDAAAALTVTLGSGADNFTIADTGVAVTIDMGAGVDLFVSSTLADTITTGAGSDTVRLTGASTDNDNIITDFTAGAGGDILDFATNNAQDGGSTLSNIETISGGADDVLEAGFVIIDNGNANIANADSLSAADIIDRLNDLGDDNNGNATDDIVSMEATNDENYVAISDGTNTAIVLITDASGDDTIIETGDVTILVTLEGVSDAGTLVSANLADFV